MEEMEKEKQKLEEILKEYKEYIEDTTLEMNNIFKLYQDKEEALKKKNLLEKKINVLKKNIEKPYFARIDFKNEEENITDICYIGKVGIINYDNKIVIVDWRAPISSLYYDSNVGKATYKVEDDMVDGELLLKRQYNIESQVLLSFNDVDTVSNDELLKPYLGVSADARLKNIVSTIQSEQNEIIRSDIHKNLIIQGVSGSGKTTVALHRIAYLVYNYKDTISNNQYMVIGPNKFFINYISSVLPDLDVNDVRQYDLIEFTNNYLEENLKIEPGYTSLSKKKTSIEFLNIINNYLDNYFKNSCPTDDLKIKDFVLLPNKKIKEVWDELNNKNYEVLSDKVDRAITLLDKYLIDNQQNNILRIDHYYDNELENGKDIKNVRVNRTNTLEQIKKSYIPLLKKYFSKVIKKATTIYKEILSNLNNDSYQYDGKIYYEDLSSLLYINYKIYGSKEYINMKHVVIDEAQDYNELTFYALKKIMKHSTFSIYGDLAQSLYPYRSLEKWEDIKDNVFKDINIKYLSKSYRTSIEIMREANKINKYLKLNEAEAVIRHADDVIYHKINDKYLDIEYYVNLYIEKGLKSIAIITKNQVESEKIYEKLINKINISIIDDTNQEYNGGICIITSKLSKGLEFDGVIVVDADEKIYSPNNQLDMKLLYVSMTRAMHNLVVMYSEDLCVALK